MHNYDVKITDGPENKRLLDSLNLQDGSQETFEALIKNTKFYFSPIVIGMERPLAGDFHQWSVKMVILKDHIWPTEKIESKEVVKLFGEKTEISMSYNTDTKTGYFSI